MKYKPYICQTQANHLSESQKMEENKLALLYSSLLCYVISVYNNTV